jgi:hypothetical protein
MCFDELAHQSKACDGSAACAFLAFVLNANELGENAYAVFNVITDFASHPPVNRHVQRDRHSLQRLAGRWLGSFPQRYREPGFSLDAYLKELSVAKTDNSFYKAGAIEPTTVARG